MEIGELLSFDSVPSQPAPTRIEETPQQSDDWATGWGSFEETQPAQQQPAKTEDKLSSLISGIESLYVNEPPKQQPIFQTSFPGQSQPFMAQAQPFSQASF